MPNCISIYNEFSSIGPMRRTWTWRIKVKEGQTFNVNHIAESIEKKNLRAKSTLQRILRKEILLH